MRMWFTSLAALALVVAGSGGPVAGQQPKAPAHRPLRIRVVAWKTTDGKQDKVPVAGATGRPIAGARVFENDVNPGRDRPLAQTSTGADGAFLLRR